MPSYNFKERQVAERLRKMATAMGPLGEPPNGRYSEFLYFKTPSGGIPAKSGATWGKASCTLYHWSYDGTDVDEAVAQDTSSTDIEATVFNWTASPIPGEAFIWAGFAGEVLVIINRDCG